MKIIQPQTPDEWDKYYDLRFRILRQPWGQPPGSERDVTDAEAYHILIQNEVGTAFGAGRMHFLNPETIQIRYMAVDTLAQGKGVGKMLLQELEGEAKHKGAVKSVLNARNTALEFYLKSGYRSVGEGETLYGVIPHTRMEKILKIWKN